MTHDDTTTPPPTMLIEGMTKYKVFLYSTLRKPNSGKKMRPSRNLQKKPLQEVKKTEPTHLNI